jgi:NADH-quinone oxidoreductase subunit A
MNPLIPLCIMAALVGGLATVFILASIYLGPKKRNPIKDTPFECGIPSEGYNAGAMSVRFYIMAMLFIIFDVELAFLFPWAASFRSLGWVGLSEMLAFFLVVGVGYVYAWKIGALEWE